MSPPALFLFLFLFFFIANTRYGLCGKVEEEYLPMCLAQQKVLQACPEYVNDWCYQDYGGSQRLRSPCPQYLICHYCLGMNPLHCATAMSVGDRERWDAAVDAPYAKPEKM